MRNAYRITKAVRHPVLSAAVLAVMLAGSPAVTLGQENEDQAGPLVLKKQGSFFVGGHTVQSDALTGTPGGIFGTGNEGDITVGQMYVRYMIPEGADQHVPIVLLHGGGLTGKTYETTPDGRMGWDEYFVRRGHATYVPDQVTRGRSGFNATVYNEVKLGVRPPSEQPSISMLSHQFQWGIFRFGPRFNQAFADEQFPVQAVEGLYRQGVPILNATLGAAGDQPNFQNLAQLAVRLRGAVVAGHSQTGFWPMQAALVNPAGMRGLINLEGNCNTTLTPEQLATLTRIPILDVLGDHLADADPVFRDLVWLAQLRGCETFVQQVNRAGGDATLLHLPEIGIFGNSHMMMQDKNNLQVADLILAWIHEHVEKVSEK